ncbi:MAG: hypothetical protein KAI64_05465, partial [Thermoplasmata archaeon]|nr:hypothetical protein [Thermoplasmata archaeon]
PYSSQSVAEEIGSAILSSRKGLKVDLDEPDVEVYVEVREDKAYVFKDAVRGPGGLPLGSQGLVVAFVEEESDIAAAWLMMKRGCKVHLAHAHQNGFLDKMKIWDPKIKFFKCEDIDGLLSLCDETGAEGIALGWDAEKALKTKLKHDVPVFYPLVGLKAEEKERLVGFILGSD